MSFEYKCVPDVVREEIVNEFIVRDSGDGVSEYYPGWLSDTIPEINKYKLEELPPNLGALHTTVPVKTSQFIKILKKIDVIIHIFSMNDILEFSRITDKHIQPDDIDKLIKFVQNPKYENTFRLHAISILTVIINYPPNISQKIYESGIFDHMIKDYMEPQWINGLAQYCHFSIEHRDQIFSLNIPQNICHNLESAGFKDVGNILYEIGSFADSLCSFPLSNDDQRNVLTSLFSLLTKSLEYVTINVENKILRSLLKFATLDPNCLNRFSKFGLFAFFAERAESFNIVNMKLLAKLMTGVMNFSYDYASHLVTEEKCWTIVLKYFFYLVSLESNLCLKVCLIISDAAIIMANVAPDFFITNNIHQILIDIYEKCLYEIKPQIGMCFYAALQKAFYTQIQILVQNDGYINILQNYFPDFSHSKFFLGANGFLNLFDYLESVKNYELISSLLESDGFEANCEKYFDADKSIIPEDKRNLFAVILKKVSKYRKK